MTAPGLIRLTAGHAAKRLNSVNPLDPGDVADPAERIARAGTQFRRPMAGRSPSACRRCRARRCRRISTARAGRAFAESLVMRLDLDRRPISHERDRPDPAEGCRPLRHARRSRCSGSDPAMRPGLSEIIGAIEPEAGLFVHEGEDEGRWPPRSACMTAISPGCSRSRPTRRARQGPCAAPGAVGAEMGAPARRASGLAAGRGGQCRGARASIARSASTRSTATTTGSRPGA